MTTSDVAPAPVVRALDLHIAAPAAFGAFTGGIGAWWPSDFCASGEDLAGVTIEGRPGGRVFEVNKKGDEYDWGKVVEWEQDRRVVLSWTLGLSGDTPTTVTATFTPTGDDSSRLDFEHGGWKAGQDEDREKFDDEGGWGVVLGKYRKHAEA